MYSFLLQTTHGGPELGDAPETRVMRGRLIAIPKQDVDEKDEEPKRQIVEVPDRMEEQDLTKKAKYLADRTVRVKKQTRSRKTAKADRNKGASNVRVKRKSRVRSAKSDSAKPTTAPKKEESVALIEPPKHERTTNDGRKPRRSHLFKGAESRLLLPATSMKNALANIQALDGSFATDDYLPDEERSDSTLLNADKYRFADYFYRIKEAVRDHWHPASVYRTRDPSGKVYGVKDRYTVLRITLDEKGALKKTMTRKASGLEFLDGEARAAFRRAQPFLNPPKGLVKDGQFSFEFGFFFEISSGRHGFRWKRL